MSLLCIPSRIKSLRYIYIYNPCLLLSYFLQWNESGRSGKKSKHKILQLLFSPFSSHICFAALSYHFPLDLFELSWCKNEKERKIYESSTFRFNTTKTNIFRVKRERILCQSFGLLIRSVEPTSQVFFLCWDFALVCFGFKLHLSNVPRWRQSIIPQKFRWERQKRRHSWDPSHHSFSSKKKKKKKTKSASVWHACSMSC